MSTPESSPSYSREALALKAAKAALKKYLAGQGRDSVQYRAAADTIAWLRVSQTREVLIGGLQPILKNLQDEHEVAKRRLQEGSDDRGYNRALIKFSLDVAPFYLTAVTPTEGFGFSPQEVASLVVLGMRIAQEDLDLLAPRKRSSKRRGRK